MPRQLFLEFELPDEILAHVRDEDLAAKAKEALIMELLREHTISQGKAAELLKITRYDLFDLMGKYKVPVIDLSKEELQKELRQPFPSE
ncbi:UPF0175 family protein [Candidatus Entotheonella palauensis]|uniref:Uncharacterized protein n=1 Tax=Candidatus Entotheonella gemina TaxID=1429439 RepID=W4LLI2_9BACT|nr:UPF0175 family protein [Candidatus Entotheonella palauensis]ETW98764.1 MAG: hypothetical protein ETSY2_42250 [Candidatus Entotheonella gemina]